jgi:hypothetical protein
MIANRDKLNSIQRLLRVIFGIVPIVAGLDKFSNILTTWTQYINPTLQGLLPVSSTTFMHIAGVIEIAAGLIVLSRFTTLGAYVVSAWLALIAVSLIASGRYLDVAVRDLIMSATAYSLAGLTEIRETESSPELRPQAVVVKPA